MVWRFILGLALLFLFSLPVQSGGDDWSEYLEQMIEDGGESTADAEALFEELSYLAEHPFNVQTLTKEELERLPFLSDKQIEEILYYIYRYGEILSLYELKNIPELDLRTIRWLLPFLYVGKVEDTSRRIEKDKLWKYAKKEVLVRTNFSFQQKAGYRKSTPEEQEASPNSYYLGEPYYLSLRGNYNYKDRILFGFAAEKDPGEVFLTPEAQGFDHWAYNLSLKGFGIIEMLALGDYQLSFGEGLALNNQFSLGKSSTITHSNQRRKVIKRHTSTGEIDFFRGVAVTLSKENWKATLFYSHRDHDANLEGNRIKSWQTTGYHRTRSELLKRNTAEVDLSGFNLTRQKDRFRWGLTAVHYSFGGKTLDPEARNYNLYYLRGKEYWNAGIHYSYRARRWALQGELALDKSGKIACVSYLHWIASDDLEMTLSLRHYDKAYNALYARGLSESTSIQNESGFYVAGKWKPKPYWEVTGYWDYFRFPYMKYGINAPSSGNDFQVQAQYVNRKGVEVTARYRYKKKMKNTTLNEETLVFPYSLHRWRFQLNYPLSPTLAWRTQVHYTIYEDIKDKQNGWSVTQLLSYTPDKSRLSVDASLTWFDSPSWNTRISVHERNVLHALSFPTYYGTGLRYYLNLKWRIREPLTIYLKLANTFYPDEEAISSGLEEIQGKNKTDFYFLVKYKF